MYPLRGKPRNLETTEHESPITDVLIVGAGPAGLTLAIELARRGVAFRLVEKAPQPFHGSRGKGIQPRTQEILEDLGVIDRLFARGGRYPAQREYREDGTFIDSQVMEHGAATPAEPFHAPLMALQSVTEGVLRERLTELGGRVDAGVELVGLLQDEEGVTAHLRHGAEAQHVRARYLVGADGGRSVVRHALDIGFPGKTLGVRAVVADLVIEGIGRDVWHRFGEGDMQRQLSLCPLAGTSLMQLQAPVPLEGEVDVSPAGLARLIAQRTGRHDIRVREVLWVSVFHMNARLADRYRVGRAFLAGDAAHVHPPTGGQGLNTSVQDAYNLGWKLAAVIHGAPARLLETYEEERRPVAAEMLGLSTRLLDAMKGGTMRRGRETQQLDLGYIGSSLALARRSGAHAILAGQRAPDAPLHGTAGQPVRLFDLFRGTHWSLLGRDVRRELVPPRAGLHIHTLGGHGDLVDTHGHCSDAYGLAAGEWVLVRPDGYIAAVIDPGDEGTLQGYLCDLGMDAGR